VRLEKLNGNAGKPTSGESFLPRTFVSFVVHGFKKALTTKDTK
jgi:hypothetical protein